MRHLILLLLCFASIFASAQSAKDPNQVIDPVLLEKMQYRQVGPSRGGRATAICGVRQESFTFYFGATGGGVWRSNDAGTTWQNVSDGQIKCGSIGAIAVAPSDPSVIYVGTGSAAPRGNISAGIGMYKSSDKGKTWKHVGLEKSGMIGKIEVHPQNPDIAFAAALGNPFGPHKERGVFRTLDGGKKWDPVLTAGDSTGCVDLVMDPSNPRILYAAMWRTERKPWTLFDGGNKGGIWKSTDGGSTWDQLKGGLPTGLLGKIGLAVSPVNPQKIWAIIITPDDATSGLYLSEDAGENWSRINRDHRLQQRGWYYSHLSADPKSENTVYLCNVDFMKSIDGGKNFDHEFPVPHGDTHGVWLNPDNPNIMINCNDGGACVSLNGGKTWSTQLNQPTSEFYRVTVDKQFPYRLYAGQQDNTTISVPIHDPGGLTDGQNWFDVGGSECADVAVNPQDPNIIWATAYSGEITYVNRATGENRQVTAYPHFTEGTVMRDLKYRFQWNAPVLVSRFDPNTIYYCSNFVHRSRNNGQSWDIISPDLTRKLDQYLIMPGGPIQHDATGVEVYSTVFVIEESPFKAGELWVGSDDGRMHISNDGGANWKEITPKNIPFECTINKIHLSSHAAGRAFVAVQNYRNNDFKPYVLRTTDFGQTWTLLSTGNNGIPENHFIRAVVEDPNRKGLLYAGTEYGMYVSFDDGAHWQALQLNLPHTPITDLEVQQKDLVMSTQGRGFWALDDLSPLHQVSNETLKAKLQLFKPRDAYRSNIYGYLPTFHCYIGKDTAKDQAAKVEILDAAGKVIRTFSKDAEPAANKLELKPGWNSFSWNLQHEGPYTASRLVLMEMGVPIMGPKVKPGPYTVKVTLGSEVQSQTFQVLPDPRWPHVKAEDYQAQEALALEMRELISDSQRKVDELRSLKKQFNETAELAVKANFPKKIQELAEELGKSLTAVEDEIVQNMAEAGQDNFNYPRRFINHIARVYSVLVWDDNRPTGGALEAYADLKKVYEGISTRYDKAAGEAMQRFEKMLSEEKVPRVIKGKR